MGTVVIPLPELGQLQLLENHALVVDDSDGKILAAGPSAALDRLAAPHGGRDAHAVTQLTASQVLVPGFIDCHIHAPQYEFTGTGARCA